MGDCSSCTMAVKEVFQMVQCNIDLCRHRSGKLYPLRAALLNATGPSLALGLCKMLPERLPRAEARKR